MGNQAQSAQPALAQAVKIGIIGATGMAGSAIYHAAKAAGMQVTAIVRDEGKARDMLGADADVLVRDSFALHVGDIVRFDVLVNAINFPNKYGYRHETFTRHLVTQVEQEPLTRVPRDLKTSPRLFFILGAGSLLTGQGDDRHLVVEDLATLPDADQFLNTARHQLAELEYLRTVRDVSWVGVSPSLDFHAGPATERIEGDDTLLYGSDGTSQVTSGTLAQAVVDEILTPRRHNQRFTVCDK